MELYRMLHDTERCQDNAEQPFASTAALESWLLAEVRPVVFPFRLLILGTRAWLSPELPPVVSLMR